MKQYHEYLRTILVEGTKQANRTGIEAISMSGAMMKFDLRQGFPAVTTKKLAFKQVKGELIGFIRGYDHAADFRALGCTIWDANANENKAWLENINRTGVDDLGRIYGVQWREWACLDEDDSHIDQLGGAIKKLLTDPTDRRIIISAWRPDEFDQMALPPCHVLYQFIANVEKNELSLCMYQRSADSFLGVPFNIASASLLLSIVARLTGFKPATFTHFLADAHIYVNHLDQVNQLLERVPMSAPKLKLSSKIKELNSSSNLKEIDAALWAIVPDDIELEDYNPYPAIKGSMAV